MIRWKDFVLDSDFGAQLDVEFEGVIQVNRGRRIGGPSVKDDASRIKIQETRQERLPARMVGSSSLDDEILASTDAGRDHRLELSRKRGEA